MGRRASRETVMKLLYQMEIQKEDKDEQVRMTLEENPLSEKDREYITNVINGVSSNMSEIDNVIEKHAKGWKMNRISKVDLSILRLCIYEISFRDDIPYNVSVNEAVELAKKYSGEEAGAFVNGILSKISKVNVPPDNKADAD